MIANYMAYRHMFITDEFSCKKSLQNKKLSYVYCARFYCYHFGVFLSVTYYRLT